ncbi:MAG: hypothetical protein WCJ30_15640 [Deltaproteobacteria bacterium]
MPRTHRLVLALSMTSLAGCPAPPVPDDALDATIGDAADATDTAQADTPPGTDVSLDQPRVPHVCARTRLPGSDGGWIPDAGSPLACNGSPALCDRRYDQVSYPTAHNAMSNADERFYLPNQHHGLTRALQDGVRGFMIDTHYCSGEPSLAHGECWLGHKPLSVGLCEFTQFLDAHPGEVVTLQIEPYVTDADTVAAFEESGLIDYARYQPPGSPYPTLRQMIDDGRRLMVFVEQGSGAPSWLMPLFDYSFDTPYTFATVADFSCRLNRGARSNGLFTLNHWLSNPTSDVQWAQLANVNPVLIDRAHRCATEAGHIPNFVAVDFYDVGDLFPTVAALNGL